MGVQVGGGVVVGREKELGGQCKCAITLVSVLMCQWLCACSSVNVPHGVCEHVQWWRAIPVLAL